MPQKRPRALSPLLGALLLSGCQWVAGFDDRQLVEGAGGLSGSSGQAGAGGVAGASGAAGQAGEAGAGGEAGGPAGGEGGEGGEAGAGAGGEAGAAGEAGEAGAGGEAGVSGSSGQAGAPGGKRPPPRPGGEAVAQGGKVLHLASLRLHLGGYNPASCQESGECQRDKVAWKNLGFDLDGRCAGGCTGPVGLVPDGNECIDNSLGSAIGPVDGEGLVFLERDTNLRLRAGGVALGLRLSDLGDGPDDPYVPGEFFLLASAEAPAWDGSDVRSVEERSLVSGQSGLPRLRFPRGYLKDNVWVSGDLGERTPGELQLPLSLTQGQSVKDQLVALKFESLTVAVPLDGDHEQAGLSQVGMVAGSSGILAELLPLFIGAATDCDASNASTLLKILSAQVQDLRVDAPGFNGEGSCDGTSVGVGIAWRRVQAPEEVGATLPTLACGACVPGARRCSPEGVPEVCVEKPQQVPAFEPEAPCAQDHPTCVEGQCARVEELACGADSVCLALASPGALDGQVYCWGQGDQRQHGQDLLSPLTRPVPLALPGKVRHLAKRYHHACAVLEDGQVYCWGNGLLRQLGPNPPPNTASSTPVAVPLPAKASRVVVGFRHSCALLVNGQAACWGSNETGQLGAAPGLIFSSTPVLVGPQGAPLDGLALLDVGEFHSCAAKGTGELFCWGARGDGVWGYQGKDKKVEPLPVLVEQGAPLEILKLAYSATFVQRQGGKLRGMGVNVEGQLGFPVQAPPELFPSFVEIPGALTLRRFVISSGEFACGLGLDDQLRCWGDNGVAQLGAPSSAPLPLTTPKVASARNVCVGGRATCAVDLQGVLRCWGNNDSGQLGRGYIKLAENDPEPVPVGWWQP